MLSPARRAELFDRLQRHSVPLAGLLVLLLVFMRSCAPQVDGAETVRREQRVLALLQAVHKAELEAAARGAHTLLWLDEICSSAPQDSPLRELDVVETRVPGVDLRAHSGYYLALCLHDPGRNDDRAWSRAMAVSPDVGTRGYSAFAWPAEYGPATQWAFFIDQRGKLLGGWNHRGLFDGQQDPFPPAAHPLRDYLIAKKEGTDAEWFVFAELDEVLLPREQGGQQ
ncbi:MAG: hypothetical protein HY812_20585 [Planctomycetes bacterium]|nr:hypothetical protein [Planctomycetota bacterium]